MEGMHPIEATGLARFMREAMYAYPITESIHIMGLGLLFGSIVVVDLRVLGLGRRVPIKPLLALALPFSVAGFVVAASTGLLMFTAHAGDFLTNPAFITKIVLIILAGCNAAALHAGPLAALRAGEDAVLPARARLFALASILLWMGVIVCGRMLAYL